MTIKFYCQHCDQRLSVPDTKAGKSVSCPTCHTQVSIPSNSEPRRNEPQSTEQQSTEPQPTEPQSTEPQPTVADLKIPKTPLNNQNQPTASDTSQEEDQLLNELDNLGSLGDSWNEILERDFEEETQPEDKQAAETELQAEAVTPQTENTDSQTPPSTDVTRNADEPERGQEPPLTSIETTTDSPAEHMHKPAPAMTAWETDEDDDDDDDGFSIRSAKSEFDEMDLTPMVDVTFLLLIFFMITASFSLQKSIQVPPPNPDEDGVSQSLQTLDDFREESIIVEIDNNNGIYVDDIKLSNPADLTQAILDRRDQGGKPKSELVLSAHKAARHETVVAVVDAANEVGMQKIRLASYRGPED